MSTSKPTNHHPYTRESLQNLDQATLIDIIVNLDATNQQLGDYIRDMLDSKYRKSDRFESTGQLRLFPKQHEAGGDSETDGQVAKKNTESQSGQVAKPKKPGHARKPMPTHLKRAPITAPTPSNEELCCSGCGTIRVAVSKFLQNSRYQIIPAQFYIEELYAVIFQCVNCKASPMVVARVPEAVENGLAGPSLLAHVAVARDFDHNPFNRQSTIYNRSGVPLNRSTISDFYAQVARILTPLYTFMHLILLQSKIISTDDTPVKVLDRTKKKNIKTGRKWAFLGDEEHPVNLFRYTTGRGRDGPLEFLKGWKGLLQGDCFSGNIAICAAAGTILVACIAHARRYFIKALLNNKQGCNQALLMFQSLYEIERTAKELKLPSDQLQLMREQEAAPRLETFKEWLQKQYATAQPKSTYGRALFYCLNNWTYLVQYLTDGDLKIDNNHTEREMKYIAMGRRAWLFFGSDKGAQDHAIVLSILSTCRRHAVEPWAYLTDVIQRLTENPHCDLEELLPYNWKPKYPVTQVAEIGVVKDAPKLRCA